MTKKASAITIFILSVIIIVLIITLFTTTANTNTLAQVTVVPTTTQTTPAAPITTKPVTTTPATQPSTFTLAQVAQHATPQNCWTTINGGVYNVTSWINQHPGGAEAIISLCGKDGSAAFNDEHGGERRPANELASFKIGTLAQ